MRDAFDGWVDINVHYGPDVVPRSQTAVEAVESAVEIGLRGICLRSHPGSSVDLAAAMNEASPATLAVVGGITLNSSAGGLNPDAVEVALAMGARIIAMPTWDAEAEPNSPRKEVPSIPLFDESGRASAALDDVLRLTASSGACIDLGPARADQLLELVRMSRAAGIERVVVSHPFYGAQQYPDDLVGAAAKAGAIIEHCYMQFDADYPGRGSVERLIAQIRAVGPEAVVLSSDSGKNGFPRLADCLATFHALLEPHFTDEELHTMFADNPAWLVGLDT
jgi:hypothetical protein